MKRTLKFLLTGILFAVAAFCLVLGACAKSDKSGKIVFTFEPNGGVMQETRYEAEAGESFEMPVPTRQGYSFGGWYTEKDLSGTPAPKTVTAEKSTKYYAAWDQAYCVTFALDGGTMSATELYVKPGDDLYAAVKELVPEKADHRFGAWLLDGSPLTSGAKMPESDVTLTARYRTAYTVELYLQTLEGGYEKGDSLVDYAYAGESVSPDPDVDGFHVVENAQAVPTKVISETVSENVFKLYFDRNNCAVTFFSNYPGELGLREETTVQNYLYGQTFSAPHTLFSLDGYCFAGWAESRDGEVKYHTDYIRSRLYGAEEGSVADEVTVVGTTGLYAVWQKGLLDLFHGQDVLYLFPDEPEAAYLQREEIFFKGTYNAARNEFRFMNKAGDEILLLGKVISDGVFVFSDDIRADATFTHYDVQTGLNENIKLYFDAYNGLSYSDQGEISTGTYTVDESNLYTATYTEGKLSGQTVIFTTGTVRTENGDRSIFMERNEEDAALGQMVRLAVRPNGISTYISPYYTLTLDGFDIARLVDLSGTTQYYYYVREGELYNLLYADGTLYMQFSVEPGESVNGYWIYDPFFDASYTLSDGSQLTLDGCSRGVYTNGTQSAEGYFMVSTSQFGYTIRLLTEEGAYTFLGTALTDDQGTAVGLDVKTVPANYGEYFYSDDQSVYFGTLAVLNDSEDGSASLYGLTQERTYALVATGSYVYNEATGNYLFTAEETFTDTETRVSPFDLTTVGAFCFNLGSRTTANGSVYNIMYWYWMTTKEEVKTDYAKVYHSADGKETLTLVGGFGIYESAEGMLSGTYSVGERFTVIVTQTGYLYVELDDETMTFLRLVGNVGSALAATGNGTDSVEADMLYFDGKGGVEYTRAAREENGEDVKYTGVAVDTGRSTDEGLQIYTFKADGMQFNYVLYASQNITYFARYSETYNGSYLTESGVETLDLDGFGHHALYITADSHVYEGSYTVDGSGLLRLDLDGGYICFNLNPEAHSFTVRGAECDTYVFVDNQEIKNLFFTLDGYGNMDVFMADPDTNEVIFIDHAGTYEISGGRYVFKYTDNGKPVEVSGLFGTVRTGEDVYRCVIADHPESMRNYVNENDLSVLVLDGYGTAVKYGQDGKTEQGVYVLITENLLYYTNGNLEAFDGCIYRYDVEKGTATPMRFTERGYYTTSLEAMRFSRYGTMTVEGVSYYYSMENSVITVYRKFDAKIDAEGSANRYGFVEEDFGEFTNEKNYHGKTYFVTLGYPIQFDRNEESSAKYPVTVTYEDGSTQSAPIKQLIFAPTGSGTFSVDGSVVIGENTFDCVVVRSVAEDGAVSLYFTVKNFRFDIKVNYTGDSLDETNTNTYEITAMRSEIAMVSNTFLTVYLFLYLNMGIVIPDTYGTISVIKEFNEAGEVEEDYITTSFGEDLLAFDAKGNVVNFEKSAYELDEETGIYTARITWEDGYDYILRFRRTSLYGVYTYDLVAFTRVQTLTTDDGYTIELERIVSADHLALGTFYNPPTVTKDGTELTFDETWRMGTTKLFYIRRQKEGEKNVSATYYIITLAELLPDTAEEERPRGYAPFESAAVEVKEAKTYTAEDGKFADIAGTEVLMIWYSEEEIYLFTESSYDEGTSTYTAKTSAGVEFRVVVTEEGTTITKVEPAAEPGEEGEDPA